MYANRANPFRHQRMPARPPPAHRKGPTQHAHSPAHAQRNSLGHEKIRLCIFPLLAAKHDLTTHTPRDPISFLPLPHNPRPDPRHTQPLLLPSPAPFTTHLQPPNQHIYPAQLPARHGSARHPRARLRARLPARTGQRRRHIGARAPPVVGVPVQQIQGDFRVGGRERARGRRWVEGVCAAGCVAAGGGGGAVGVLGDGEREGDGA